MPYPDGILVIRQRRLRHLPPLFDWVLGVRRCSVAGGMISARLALYLTNFSTFFIFASLQLEVAAAGARLRRQSRARVETREDRELLYNVLLQAVAAVVSRRGRRILLRSHRRLRRFASFRSTKGCRWAICRDPTLFFSAADRRAERTASKSRDDRRRLRRSRRHGSPVRTARRIISPATDRRTGTMAFATGLRCSGSASIPSGGRR